MAKSLQERVHQALVGSSLLARRRALRATFFLRRVQRWPGMKVLDVGCGVNGRSFEDFAPEDMEIEGIDLHDPAAVSFAHPGFRYVQRSATELHHYADGQFDLVVSIGMMEHITEGAVLRRMAEEIDRVGRQYVIVVPWRYAIVEPHFKFPFFQLLPYEAQLGLTRALNLHRAADKVRADPTHIRRQYQWFTSAEWQAIWPGSKVHVSPTLDTIAIVKSL